MDGLGRKVFARSAMMLTVMCVFCLLFVQRGSAEFFILLLSGIINCAAVVCSLICTLKRRGKE